MVEGRPVWTVIGFKGGLALVDENGKMIVHAIENFHPFIIDTADINGDGLNEIIVADWTSDSIIPFKVTSRGNLKRLSEIKIGSNILSIAHGDIDGDGFDELVCISEQINESLYVIDGNKISRFDSYPALLGVTIGNALGFDGQEIIARTGRESLSLILAVPRISLNYPIIEGHEFNISIATIGSAKLSLGSSIEMKDKSKYYRTKISKRGYLILTKYTAIPKKPGTTVISLKQDSKTAIKKVINIAADGILESSIGQVSLLDEDVIKLSLIHI